MTDKQIRQAMQDREIILDPLSQASVQPASYDMRVGTWAFTSSGKEKLNLSQKGVLVIEPGEFAVVESREHVTLSANMAGQIGLRSEYAGHGLLMLSGPQIDPGWHGIIVVRLVNLAPKSIALAHEETFLTAQFFRLSEPASVPYSGPRQGQTGITSKDIQELIETEGLTLGGVIKILTAQAKDIAELRGSVNRLAWLVPLIVAIGMGVVLIK